MYLVSYMRQEPVVFNQKLRFVYIRAGDIFSPDPPTYNSFKWMGTLIRIIRTFVNSAWMLTATNPAGFGDRYTGLGAQKISAVWAVRGLGSFRK